MNIYELIPTNGRKSFYGKAKVIIEGNTKKLLSYTTIVAEYNEDSKEFKQLIDKPTSTTNTHLKTFKSSLGL